MKMGFWKTRDPQFKFRSWIEKRNYPRFRQRKTSQAQTDDLRVNTDSNLGSTKVIVRFSSWRVHRFFRIWISRL